MWWWITPLFYTGCISTVVYAVVLFILEVTEFGNNHPAISGFILLILALPPIFSGIFSVVWSLWSIWSPYIG